MRIEVTAQWPIAQADIDYVINNHVRPKFTQAAVAVRKCFPNVPLDPFGAFSGWLHVNLYGWSTPDGTAGQYISLPGPEVWGFQNSAADCAVNVAWPIEHDLGHRVLMHEFRHMLAHMACGSGNFGHGDVDDPMIRYMLSEADDVFHTNQDDAFPDVRLRHVRDLGKDLVVG